MFGRIYSTVQGTGRGWSCCFSYLAYWLSTRKTTLHDGQCCSWSAEQEKKGETTQQGAPWYFATQQGTPFYPAGMSAADWSTLVFTLPKRKIAWVYPTKATFFQNCTLILDKYPVVSEMKPFHRPFLPQKSLSTPARGHQIIHLSALNIQCGTGIKDLHPALPHRLFPL